MERVVESESILSREEIAALLSAIREPDAPEPSAVQPVDFSKPRRLLTTQLERLRDLHTPLLESVKRVMEKALNAPVQVRLLDPGESTFAELLEDRPGHALLARAGDVLIDPSPRLAFALVERALGAARLTRPPDRPLRDLEVELLTPTITALLEALAPAWSVAPLAAVQWAPVSGFMHESWPEGSCAVIGVEVLSEGLLGDVVLALSSARFDPVIARPAASDAGAAPGVDIEAAARFPLGSLRLGDVRELAPGDLLVWGGSGAPAVTVEISKRPKFTGRPGSLHGKAAVEVIGPADQEPGPVSITRVSGGGRPAGAPDVPVEVRAVLAERSISLASLGSLRPGALIEFPGGGGPADLRLGRRIVARGRVVRQGDRLALEIDADSRPRGL
jgi:flagellar motor switch protein FliM